VSSSKAKFGQKKNKKQGFTLGGPQKKKNQCS
jgi:hypothetical protein